MLRRLPIAAACVLSLAVPHAAAAAERCERVAPPRWLIAKMGVLREARTPADRLPRRPTIRLPIERVARRFVRRLPRAPEEERPSYVVPGGQGCRPARRYLCLVSIQPGGNSTICRPVRRATMFSPMYYLADYERDGELLRVQDLVPDGVAKVEVTLRDGQVRTVPVGDNRWAAVFPAPQRPESGLPPPPLRLVRWLDAAGAEIARSDFPTEER